MTTALKNIWLINLFAICLFTPFSGDLNFLPALLALLSLIIIILNRKSYGMPALFIPIVYFLVLFLGIFLTREDIGYRLRVSDTQLQMLAIPLCFMVIEPRKISRNLDKFMLFFILGNLLATAEGFMCGLSNVYEEGLPLSVRNIDHFFGGLYHHTYFSLNALIGLFFIIHLLFGQPQKKWMKGFLIVAWFFINLGIYVVCSRVGIVLALLVNLYFIWLVFKVLRSRRLKLVFPVLYLALIVAGFFLNDNLDYLRGVNHDEHFATEVFEPAAGSKVASHQAPDHSSGVKHVSEASSRGSESADSRNGQQARSDSFSHMPDTAELDQDRSETVLERFLNKGTKAARPMIWKAAIREGWKKFPWGHGTATANLIIRESLEKEYSRGDIKLESPNAHNQFLDAYLENGLPGLILLLLMLYVLFRAGMQRKDKTVLAWLVIVVTIALFESILKRRMGLQSFIVFYSIFMIHLHYLKSQVPRGKNKLIRITTVPVTMNILLKGQLKYLKNRFAVTGITSPGSMVQEVREREGIPVKTLRMHRSIRPFFDLIALIRMSILLKREKPDIVHTQTPKAGFVGILGARMAGIRHRVHSVVGLPVQEQKGLKQSLVAWADRMVYRNATRVLCNSMGLKAYLAERKYMAGDKIEVLGHGTTNGIDLEYFEDKSEIREKGRAIKLDLFGSEDVITFLYVGRIVKDKGVNELITAFGRLSESFPRVRLILVGEYESKNAISRETRRRIDTNDAIVRAGYQADVRPYLSLADCFVFPSYREGFPNVVLQALAFDLPCIATDINGANEVIVHEENGWLIPVKDADSLCGAMQSVCEGRALKRSSLPDNRQILADRFDQKNLWQEYVTFYENL